MSDTIDLNRLKDMEACVAQAEKAFLNGRYDLAMELCGIYTSLSIDNENTENVEKLYELCGRRGFVRELIFYFRSLNNVKLALEKGMNRGVLLCDYKLP